jgi:hypothetical protein
MMATTSFMGQPFRFLRVFPAQRAGQPFKSGIFRGKWHKKLAALSGNIRQQCEAGPVQRRISTVKIRFPAWVKRSAFVAAFILGSEMSNRSWFFAAGGQQQGPYPEAQFRDFVARGTVRAETLVWTDGMAGWQKAGEIPGLLSGGDAPPAMPRAGGGALSDGRTGGQLSIDIDMWPFLGRSILFVIGMLLVIPAPWVAVSYYRWMASRMVVPGHPNFAFTGRVGDIWYVFVILALCSYSGSTGHTAIQVLVIPLEGFLSWMILRWIASNLSSNGQQLPLSFEGNALAYVGWHLLMFVSMITIIGWAWVIPAWMRWNCRHVHGTRREILFKASGLEVLWRTVVFVIGCAFLIPIPWVLRWYVEWYVSQFALEPPMA